MTTIDLNALTLAHGGHDTRDDGVCAMERTRERNGTYVREAMPERFWRRVRQGSGCWEWQGTRTAQGYGGFRIGGTMRKAHRVAWELTHGPIPPGAGPHGTCVLHRCDNPGCVRPDHLFLGTNRDNARDREAKGRTARANLLLGPEAHRAKTHCPSGHAYDERNTGIRANGRRWCRACARTRARQQRASRKEIAA